MSISRLTLQAAAWFKANVNVIQEATQKFRGEFSQKEIIETSYDLQAGSYIRDLGLPGEYELKEKWGARLAGILLEHKIQNACEAGIGEATTLAFVEKNARGKIEFAGFDISMSRLLHAQKFLAGHQSTVNLFCADMAKMPFPDSSVEAVLANHSLEPNGSNELPLLRELERTASRFLVLIEPDYERASAEQRARMDQHNYVRGLRDQLAKLPGRIIRDEPWPYWHNELNKASLLIFEKNNPVARNALPPFVTPVNKLPLKPLEDFLFCAEEGLLYPRAFGIPVLKEEAAILCFHAGSVRA